MGGVATSSIKESCLILNPSESKMDVSTDIDNVALDAPPCEAVEKKELDAKAEKEEHTEI